MPPFYGISQLSREINRCRIKTSNKETVVTQNGKNGIMICPFAQTNALLSHFSRVRLCATPPGSPLPGILQARTLEWVAISFSNA